MTHRPPLRIVGHLAAVLLATTCLAPILLTAAAVPAAVDGGQGAGGAAGGTDSLTGAGGGARAQCLVYRLRRHADARCGDRRLLGNTTIAEATHLYLRYDGTLASGTDNNAFTAGLGSAGSGAPLVQSKLIFF